MKWAHPPVFTHTQWGENNTQPCWCPNGQDIQGFGSMRDCWLKCHTLREINEFYWGGWNMLHALCFGFCFPLLSLILVFMPCCSSVCYAWWWRWGGTSVAWMGHTYSSTVFILANCAKIVAFVPFNSLISWARCWCYCLSVWLAAAVISAYLNCELMQPVLSQLGPPLS